MSILKKRGNMCLTMKERKAVVVETVPRYRKASKKQKSIILDEFSRLTGFTRNHSCWVLRNHGKKIILYNKGERTVVVGDVRKKRTVRKRPPVYTSKELEKPLIKLLEISDYLCSKRLVPFIRNNLPSMNKKLGFKASVVDKLMKISASTIDRMLKNERKKYKLKGRSTTKRGKLIKGQIPIRTFSEWDDKGPGFFQIDLVSHDGGKAVGDYIFTLNATDVDTGWTEPKPIKNKAQIWTEQAIDEINKILPYPMLGIDSDNGAEFINNHLMKYCVEHHITFTRGRPYKKNDSCYVEEKNNSVVRKTVGYFRYEEDALEILEELYSKMSKLINFFQPSVRLVSKTRIGSKVKKKYDKPQTPYERLLNSNKISNSVKKSLKEMYKGLDIITIHQKIKILKRKLEKHAKKL